ncbi:hypothetical protein ES708_21610 [subsurface metagenome]
MKVNRQIRDELLAHDGFDSCCGERPEFRELVAVEVDLDISMFCLTSILYKLSFHYRYHQSLTEIASEDPLCSNCSEAR